MSSLALDAAAVTRLVHCIGAKRCDRKRHGCFHQCPQRYHRWQGKPGQKHERCVPRRQICGGRHG
jgi:hypothetical protein